MTPQQPPPPEEPSLPARHRPSMENLSKDTTEGDLWDLDNLSTKKNEEEPERPKTLPRQGLSNDKSFTLGPGTLSPTEVDDPSSSPIIPILASPRHKARHNSNVERLRHIGSHQKAGEQEVSSPLQSPQTGVNKVEITFDDLEHWDDPEPVIEEVFNDSPDVSPVSINVGESVPVMECEPSQAEIESCPPPPPPDAEDAEKEAEKDDEFTLAIRPNAQPLSLRPKLGLTTIEKVGLISLTLILLGGGFWVYKNTLNRLIRQSSQTQQVDFPVKGKHVTVIKVATYWRKPITKGSQVEAVRRGVVLIPVAELTLQGGNGAIRVIFKKDDGTSIGDAITHAVNGETTLSIPATDGFEESSMHAAYRTGQTKPWAISIAEASSINASGNEFKELFKLPISPEKR